VCEVWRVRCDVWRLLLLLRLWLRQRQRLLLRVAWPRLLSVQLGATVKGTGHVCVCVCVCVYNRTHVCVCGWVCVWVWVWVCG
jgi:hypothetical protein